MKAPTTLLSALVDDIHHRIIEHYVFSRTRRGLRLTRTREDAKPHPRATNEERKDNSQQEMVELVVLSS